jgi:hypothetical protein
VIRLAAYAVIGAAAGIIIGALFGELTFEARACAAQWEMYRP